MVVDSQDEILWRLRALCGLRNTIGSPDRGRRRARRLGHPKAPELAKDRFKLDIQTVTYAELGKLIKAALADKAAVDAGHEAGPTRT